MVDASGVSAWALVDEQLPATDELYRRAAVGVITAPVVLWFEIRNVLVIQGRRGRVRPVERDEFLDALEGLHLRLDRAADSPRTSSIWRSGTGLPSTMQPISRSAGA